MWKHCILNLFDDDYYDKISGKLINRGFHKILAGKFKPFIYTWISFSQLQQCRDPRGCSGRERETDDLGKTGTCGGTWGDLNDRFSSCDVFL